MTPFILSLADPDATLETVGGKGASLAKLTRAGLPVPGGFHITTAAYREFVAANGIQPKILEALAGVDADDAATLEPASRRIAAYFIEGSIPAEIEAAISAAYAQLGAIPVAVRSSATAEDLPEASFAGQQDTFLNISGTGAVLDAVKRCWASLWTGRAIAYRAAARGSGRMRWPWRSWSSSWSRQTRPGSCSRPTRSTAAALKSSSRPPGDWAKRLSAGG